MRTLLATDTGLGVSIRPATREDIPVIMDLAWRIWPVAYGDILTPEQTDNLLKHIYSEENLLKEMGEGHLFWLAYAGSEAAGYISAYRESERTVFLKKIYIDPDQQGKGIGKKLIATIVEFFRPASEIKLVVNSLNVAAQHFYERTGFIRIGEMQVQMGDYYFNDFIYLKSIES